ncbi:hypothetical protein DFJ74DRAFT_41105 [Hyaloraphidium curvatum]|nr:hypothetical protein DFJ74DRAFT_41105 [Hyaloraphidium curvatum]
MRAAFPSSFLPSTIAISERYCRDDGDLEEYHQEWRDILSVPSVKNPKLGKSGTRCLCLGLPSKLEELRIGWLTMSELRPDELDVLERVLRGSTTRLSFQVNGAYNWDGVTKNLQAEVRFWTRLAETLDRLEFEWSEDPEWILHVHEDDSLRWYYDIIWAPTGTEVSYVSDASTDSE